MASGLLEVDGQIDLSQFWPAGSSDADTSQVTVEVNAFRFRSHPGAPFATTNVFNDAKVKGTGTHDAVKNGKIRVRLQGIDASELHYMPKAEKKVKDQTKEQRKLYLEWNHDYRQLLAETATVELSTFLEGLGAGPLPCKVRTAVDSPEDVYDTYGRFVGEVFVQSAGQEVDVNHWIIENGWAFPSFYASMSSEEIGTIIDLANTAWSADAGVWPYFTDSATPQDFDWDIRFRKGGPPAPNADRGPVVLPKLFRRLSTYAVSKRAKMVTGTFEKYLRSKRGSDTVHLTQEFLDQGPSAAPVHFLDEFVQSGVFTVWPEDLVFREKPSTVVGPGGTPITGF